MFDSSSAEESGVARLLQEESRGRTVLTILYLIVLGLCFIVPIFYYFRMHCEDRQARRMREMELAGVEASLREQQQTSREETRAARRKYREEKRARLLQLFAPVRMTLTVDNFPHMRRKSSSGRTISPLSSPKSSKSLLSPRSPVSPLTPLTPLTPLAPNSPRSPMPPKSPVVQEGSFENSKLGGSSHRKEVDALLPDVDLEEGSAITEDELFLDDMYGETTVVEIPQAGLSLEQSKSQQKRAVSNMCAICLSGYEIGDDIVWSSNPACEHAFHKECIERWLIKQRGSPLCPCCRRDFVLDPLDVDEEMEGALGQDSTTPNSPTDSESRQQQQHQQQQQLRHDTLSLGFGVQYL
mmetsp:Transcript_9365/g.15682  ORF Transcript_9365/g.15682 Transcript_9365/m.15682 type:complete len:354 (-) Transcript_9365:104-1165(-)